MAQSILTNTIFASVGRVINIAAGLLATALIVHILNPDTYGQYVFLFSVGTILQLAADFGLYLTLARELGRTPHQTQELFHHIATLRLALLCLFFLLGSLLFIFMPAYRALLPAYATIAFGLTAQSVSQLFMGVFQARSIVWQATVGDLIGRLIQIILLLALVRLAAPAQTVTAVTVIFTASIIGTLLSHQWFLKSTVRFRLAYALPRWQSIIRQSWPLGAMLVINAIYFRIDAVMLSYMRSASEVGFYGLSYKIMESLLFFPAMLGGILLPALSRHFANNRAQAADLLHQSLRLTLTFATFSTLLLAAYPQLFIYLITFTDFSSYTDAIPLLRILSLATGIIFIGNIIGFALVAAGQQKQLLYLYSILALANSLGNLLLIPRFGAPAAAWTTVATELAALTTAFLLLSSHLPLRPFLALLPRLLVTLLPPLAFILFASPQIAPILGLAITSTLYLLAAIATGLFRWQSLSLLRQPA